MPWQANWKERDTQADADTACDQRLQAAASGTPLSA